MLYYMRMYKASKKAAQPTIHEKTRNRLLHFITADHKISINKKTNTCQFRRVCKHKNYQSIMKKQFIIALFALIACGTRAYAQSSLMATLSHENEISTFYGANALQEAHAASAHGDVITLSSGSFAGVDITKAVTIRGAGMEVDTVNNIEPTIISTDFSIEIPDSVGKSLTIEGIYTNRDITVKNLSNAKFLKSRFGYIDYANANASVMKDLDFINCRIAKNISVSNNSSALFQNSIVQNVTTAGITTYFLSFNNCIIRGGGSMDNSEYKNNIIINCGNGNNQSTYYNNLFIGNYDNIN